MNDRLGDLPAWASDSDGDFGPSPAGGDGGGDVEMGETPKQPTYMKQFFQEAEAIKSEIEAIKKATKAIADISDHALQAMSTEEENELSRKLRTLVDHTNKKAKQTKNLLGSLKEETKILCASKKIKQSDVRYVVTWFYAGQISQTCALPCLAIYEMSTH